jgi:2-polyprenyl-3-methyl-5-hydroxy-6-metoxy-1,4-benzoquinol methylase
LAGRVVTISNPIYQEFIDLGLIDSRNVELIATRTRDLEIPVYRDKRSKVIFLGRVVTSDAYYQKEKAADREGDRALVPLASGAVIRSASLDDSRRRFGQFKARIQGKVICDFGCGYGGFLNFAAEAAKQAFGVELREDCLDHIAKDAPGIDVRKGISDHAVDFDVVTMFHVLEHIPYQTDVLTAIRAKLKPGGEIIVEVPHAEDFLIQSIDLPEFRAFTFWSEHLVLHTRASLRTVMQAAGFRDVEVLPYQRYGFTNHLHWFLERKPGGHETFAHLENRGLEEAYMKAREADFTCDTLIGIGRK